MYNNIMQNQQSQPICLMDSIYHPTTTQNYAQHWKYQQKQDNSSQQDNKWIQDYLAPSALVDYSPLNAKYIEGCKEGQNIEILLEFKDNQPETTQTPKKSRSVFHNFQKHLITLLKKLVYIRRVDISDRRAGARALELWKIFQQGREYSKKSLYLVFGVNQTSNDSLIVSLAQSIPQLQKILTKYGSEEIENAQALLRRIVTDKLSNLAKVLVQQQCKMSKFEQFYAYFLHFIAQLQGDGLCKRLKKQQKIKVFERNI